MIKTSSSTTRTLSIPPDPENLSPGALFGFRLSDRIAAVRTCWIVPALGRVGLIERGDADPLGLPPGHPTGNRGFCGDVVSSSGHPCSTHPIANRIYGLKPAPRLQQSYQ
jgi:hypothetical protein